MQNNFMGTIMLFAVFFIIGMAVLPILYQTTDAQASLTTITDDQFTLSNTSCVDVTDGCITSLTSVENATGTEVIGSGNYSLCNVETTAPLYDGISFESADTSIDRYNGETVNATYVESSDCSYVSNSSARSLSAIALLFFVIFLVIGGIIYLRNSGLFDMFKK